MPFPDITRHWARACIDKLAQRQLVRGYPDGTFRPDNRLTRTEFAILLCRAFPEAPVRRTDVRFWDIPRSYWAFDDIHKAGERGFFAGYPDGSFQPHRPIPRIEAILAIAAHLELRYDGDVTAALARWYDDSGTIAAYARETVAAATQAQQVVSYPNPRQFNGDRPLTRGEATALLCRALELEGVPPEYVVGVDPPPRSQVLAGAFVSVPLVYGEGTWSGGRAGIWVSTLSPQGKLGENVHGDRPLTGEFELLTRVRTTAEAGAGYWGCLLYNPGDRPLTVRVLAAASAADDPTLPLPELPERSPNPDGGLTLEAERWVADRLLRGDRGSFCPDSTTLNPGEAAVLCARPLPSGDRPMRQVTRLKLWSSQAVQVASLLREGTALPSLSDWLEVVQEGEGISERATVRDRAYWRSPVGDESPVWVVSPPGSTDCFAVESSSDTTVTVEQALYNNFDEAVSVAVSLSSPSELSAESVTFEASDRPTFRAPVRIHYRDFAGTQLRDISVLALRQGLARSPLAVVRIPPGSSRSIALTWIVPPDARSSPVLTLKTL